MRSIVKKLVLFFICLTLFIGSSIVFGGEKIMDVKADVERTLWRFSRLL